MKQKDGKRGGHASDPEKLAPVLTVSHVNTSNYIIRMMLMLTNLPYAYCISPAEASRALSRVKFDVLYVANSTSNEVL